MVFSGKNMIALGGVELALANACERRLAGCIDCHRLVTSDLLVTMGHLPFLAITMVFLGVTIVPPEPLDEEP